MKVYRIKHKPTGLFYQPVKGKWLDDRTNFGKTGKVYIARKPTLKDISSFLSISKKQSEDYGLTRDSGGIMWQPHDFEIICYNMVEDSIVGLKAT